MSSDWLLVFAPIIGLGTNLATQIGCAHLLRRMGTSIIAGILCGFAATIVATGFGAAPAYGLADVVAAWVVSVTTYGSLAYGYWNFLNLSITSLRIRMLLEIAQADGTLSKRALAASYTDEEFLRRRLERLERGKQLSRMDGRWRLESRTLLLLAQLLDFLRALLLPSETRPDKVQ